MLLQEWLRSVGLEEYAPVFAAERITLADLSSLTDQDLRELGLVMGDRRRFRRAVLERGVLPIAPPPDSAVAARRHSGERRPLTVMFIDMVDSTGLAERLADEEMLDVIRGFRELCGAAIQATGGRIAKYLGDGILAYFCYPIAHENDPHRAARAGLQIAAAASALRSRSGQAVAVRVGIATGSVILGDLFEGGEPELLAATGSPLNLAARLQTCAPSNGVVIGDATYGRIGHLFQCDDLGVMALKGFGPVHCWQVRSEADARTQDGAFGPTLPLRGRDVELRQLAAIWDGVAVDQGRAVLLQADAGVGKSALVTHFIRCTALPQNALVTLAGSDLDRDTPFYPVVNHLRAMSAAIGGQGLRALIARGRGSPDESAALLAKLAGLPFDVARIAHLSPPQQRDRTLDAAADLLLAGARTGPLCLLVEDLHWFDPSTAELLARLIERARSLQTLLLMTARPEFEPPWPARAPVATIALHPLRQAEVREMTADLLGSADMPPALLARILERTDGVPLFVQAVVRQIQQGIGPGPPDWDGGGQDVPSSLHEALMSRLDHAGPAKEVAQAASSVGRRVDRALLGAIVDLAPAALDDCLVTLVDGGVLRPDGGADHGYLFTHALVRDVAYNSLLREPRQALHARVADAMLLLDPDAASHQPATLALHLTEAGRYGPATQCWLEAGRKAVAASALTEATRLLRRGLAALAHEPPSADRTRVELQLLGLLGPALIARKGPGAAETRAHYERAYQLCQDLEEEPAHFPLYWGWWRTAQNFPVMQTRSAWLLNRAKLYSDPGPTLQAHHCNWANSYNLGQFGRCCEHIEAGLAIYGDGDWRHHQALYGNHDALACATGELALVHWMQGKPDGGLPHHRRSLSWGRDLRHLGSLMHSMDFGLVFQVMRQDHAEVYRAAEELTAVTVEHGFADHAAKGQIFRGWATAMREDAPRGLRLLEEGFAKQRDIGTDEDFPIYICLLAEALMANNQPERAVAELQAARAQFDATGLRVWLPEVLRMTAAATTASQAGVSPLPLLAEAAAMAADQGVAMLGLRIAHDRALALAALGDEPTAATTLAAALAALPARDTPDHARATALTARLRTARLRAG